MYVRTDLCPIHTADADATKLFCRVGVGGVYWALDMLLAINDKFL